MIETWLQTFKSKWLEKDIDGVLALFSDDVSYFETPFQQIHSKSELAKEWSVIKDQDAIELGFDIFSSSDQHHTILWDLSYLKAGVRHYWSGVYLITLNSSGLCKKFYQVGEKKFI